MRNTEALANLARSLVLKVSFRTSSPHLSSSLSVLDSLICLGHVEAVDESNSREIYLSKGHAALGLYASMVALGKLPQEALESYCADGSHFEGHVNSKVPGIPLSTGSLGHAAAFAIGRALGDLSNGIRRQHWVVLSDGELDEGSNWEAFLIGAHCQIPNLHFLIDRNRIQSLGSTENTVSLEPLAKKLGAFGLSVIELNGHDHVELKRSIASAEGSAGPTALIAHTTKGFGLDQIEKDAVLYHYKPATQELLDAFQAKTGL